VRFIVHSNSNCGDLHATTAGMTALVAATVRITTPTAGSVMSGATPTAEVCRSTSRPLPALPMRISDPAARHCRHRCRREREGEGYRVGEIRIQQCQPSQRAATARGRLCGR
jgi:hypothetical protein